MGKIVNKIPAMMSDRGWTPNDLIGMGLAQNTAYRAWRGDTDFTLETVGKLCSALGVKIEDLFEYQDDEPDAGN